MNKNYYKILELEPGSSVAEIKSAYRRLAKKYHPDLNKSVYAHQLFIEVNEAYEILMHQMAVRGKNTNGTPHDENYEEFIRKVREAAQQQAKMRYEKFVKENAAFRESGLYDLTLVLKYIGSAILPFFGLGLVLLPIFVAISTKEFSAIFYLLYFWVIGFSILFIIYTKRKNYFKLGKFYYSVEKLKALFKEAQSAGDQECFFSKGHKANSIPYKIPFYKILSINLQNKGPLQHLAGYKRVVFDEVLPRSQKAFTVHFIVSLFKISCILGSLFFFRVDSLVWRIILGFFLAWFVSFLVLLVTNTKSKSGYLFSWGMLIKIIVWLGIISLVSKFSMHPFNIQTSESIQFAIVIMAFGDAFLEQLIKLPAKMKIFKPLLRSYKKLNYCFDKNYFLYLEIPIWTAIYPILRWIF